MTALPVEPRAKLHMVKGGPTTPRAPIPPGPRKPTIEVREGEADRQAEQLLAALVVGERELYSQDQRLVHVVMEPERREPMDMCKDRGSLAFECSCGSQPGEPCFRAERRGSTIIGRPGTPKIAPMSQITLWGKACRVANWIKYTKKGEQRRVDPHDKTVAMVYEAQEWKGIPPLRGIAETPYLSPSLRIVTRPGYDEETGILLTPNLEISPIPERPTREQAQAALKDIWVEMACDFPFVGLGEPSPGDPHRDLQFELAKNLPGAFVGVTMVLNILARSAIRGPVPSGLFEASSPGSGKTRQIHSVSVITTGRPAATSTYPVNSRGVPNEEEMSKVLTGYAAAGAQLVVFDNVRGKIEGQALEMAMTSSVYRGRLLGGNKIGEFPWIAQVALSANNATSSRDFSDRMLVSRIETKREDPRSRDAATFRHPRLLAALKKLRPRLVWDALVILRAFVTARESGLEMPSVGTMGSFEEWSELIPPAILWAGGPNIIGARPAPGESGDEDSEAHATLIRMWRQDWNGQRAIAILDKVFPSTPGATEVEMRKGTAAPDGLDDLRAAIRALTHTREGGTPNAQVFGSKLWHLRGTPKLGKCIRLQEGSTVRLWSVEEMR